MNCFILTINLYCLTNQICCVHFKTHPFLSFASDKKSWKFSTSKCARLRSNTHKLKSIFMRQRAILRKFWARTHARAFNRNSA